MGCAGSCGGKKFTEEEKIMTRFEGRIGYGNKKSQLVVDTTRSMSTEGITSRTQFDELIKSLRLKYTDLGVTGSASEMFLNSFKIEGSSEESFDNNMLVLTGLLLSKAPKQ